MDIDTHSLDTRISISRATRRTPHGASRLVQETSTWLVKTRRAPSRHCRDARGYGHTAAVMHDMITRPPSLCRCFPPTALAAHQLRRSRIIKPQRLKKCNQVTAVEKVRTRHIRCIRRWVAD